MVEALVGVGIEVIGQPAASFVTIAVPDGTALKERLRDHGYAVRSCANFVGMGPNMLRLAVRDEHTVAGLIDAMGKAGR
jgi:histidinol-phosphate aminotransferase